MIIEAKFEDDVFKPIGKVKLEEGTVVEIRVKGENTPAPSRSISEFGFTGMWADRSDIKDGVTYVNTLRYDSRA